MMAFILSLAFVTWSVNSALSDVQQNVLGVYLVAIGILFFLGWKFPYGKSIQTISIFTFLCIAFSCGIIALINDFENVASILILCLSSTLIVFTLPVSLGNTFSKRLHRV
ncbi:hypothetical protein FT643_14755 [Ketobacter sp. MCCC 1A13808]|uniref:hypothetical protein n=1 Tax=Ketobacter sp. MCCC 1A13808 TaxID=2602738 RepID=UPI0012EBA649|nr:hypothetical protein [Ketobacter sp. MCCC 1A13808]MVF13399.1 hypothetical protein [Ketobacter sp. MCCC 1A13808]